MLRRVMVWFFLAVNVCVHICIYVCVAARYSIMNGLAGYGDVRTQPFLGNSDISEQSMCVRGSLSRGSVPT